MLPPAAIDPGAVPAAAHPATWLLAFLCLHLEVRVLQWALGNRGVGGKEVHDRLVLAQLLSWVAVVATLHAVAPVLPAQLAILGVLVLGAETAALHVLIARPAPDLAGLAWWRLLGYAAAGNLAALGLCALVLTTLALVA